MGGDISNQFLRQRELFRERSLWVKLTYYPPEFWMPRHAHETDQLSVLLAGSLYEQTTLGEVMLNDVSVGFKPAGERHENKYGNDGALILSLNKTDMHTDDQNWTWCAARARPAITLLSKIMVYGNCNAVEFGDVAEELFTIFADVGQPIPNPPSIPKWLEHVVEQLDDDPCQATLAVLANSVGVHRVYLSRKFSEAFGVPISIYRRRSMASRAVRELVCARRSPVEAAHMAGFSDQSHLTRVLRAETGLTPRQIGAL